jgi:hypothetical protein
MRQTSNDNNPAPPCGNRAENVLSLVVQGIGSSSSAESVTQLAEDFVIRGKAICLMFRVNQLSIHHDIKDSAAAFDHFRFDTCCFSNCVRQTDGLRGVVSLYAVGDADCHPEFLRC